MWQRLFTQFLIPGLIAGAITLLVLWLFQLGRVKPAVAYFSPVATAFGAILATFFILFGIANRLYGGHQSLWIDALCFGGGGAFAVGTIDSAFYRLTWDNDGFRVRRFLGKSFAATWSQVKSVVFIPGEYGGEYRVELNHPDKKAFNFSSFLVGNREFRALLRRKTPLVVP